MKNILLAAIISLFVLQSCGESKPTDATDPENTTVTTNTNTETDAAVSNTTTENTTTETGESVITSEVMEKVCACVNGAKGDSGEADIAKIKECMGGSSADYVAQLLGGSASEKQKADAQNELQERMKTQCPIR